MICLTCKRDLVRLTKHHTIPKELGGKDTINICNDCHNAIHANFSNKELKKYLYNLDLILANPVLKKAFDFLSKQTSGKRFRNKRSNRRKKRR